MSSQFGDDAITRGPDRQTVTASKFGSGYINRYNSGGTTTTSKFGDGTLTRGNGGSTAIRPAPSIRAKSFSELFPMGAGGRYGRR